VLESKLDVVLKEMCQGAEVNKFTSILRPLSCLSCLAGLAQTIERVANMLDTFRANLCQKCKLTEVREMLVVKPSFSRKVR